MIPQIVLGWPLQVRPKHPPAARHRYLPSILPLTDMFPGASAQDITGQHRTALAGAAYAKPNLMVTTIYISQSQSQNRAKTLGATLHYMSMLNSVNRQGIGRPCKCTRELQER
jgi:hypothetical protein